MRPAPILHALVARLRRRRVRSNRPAADRIRARRRRRERFGPVALLVVVAYVPLLLTARGQVGADTKQYLYLDPVRLLERAPSLWDPHVGFGTVTHQNIGYLWPMGPYYWLLERLGAPDWVAQRLWLGSLLFFAGAGVLWLARLLGPFGERRNRGAAAVAALVYMLTPYTLTYAARISAILLPYAGLPWMLGLVVIALRREAAVVTERAAQRDEESAQLEAPSKTDAGSTGHHHLPSLWSAVRHVLARWRLPAIFALVVTTVGSVNATALIYVGLAPVLWFPYAIWVNREVRARQAIGVLVRIAVLTSVTQLWWIAGLRTQAGWGLPVLEFTETVETVSETAVSSEVLRGLGNWFFYGHDRLGAWIEPSLRYTQDVWLIATSFAIPALAFVAAAYTRWRHRLYFVVLFVIGVIAAVGTHPYDDPSPLGRVFKAAAEGSTAGLAMRSSPRAAPLIALSLAFLIGTGLVALGHWATERLIALRRPPRIRWQRVPVLATLFVGLLAVVNAAPLWTGTVIGGNLQRPEDLPPYWIAAAHALDAVDPEAIVPDGVGPEAAGPEVGESATRVLELPGSDFASYRWGNTVDPITPGLIDRPWAARELIPFGTAASADLLIALDRRLQEGVLDVDAIAPIARLLGVGDIVLRSDLQYERYRTPRPRPTWERFLSADGLLAPESFGDPVPNRAVSDQPLIDETELAIAADAPHPPPVAIFPVADSRPIVRAEPVEQPTVVAGDGEGLVDAAAAGLLDGDAVVVYSADVTADLDRLRTNFLAEGADLVVTDSNRRRGQRWGTIRENLGYTEEAGERPLVVDQKDNRNEVFPDRGDEVKTVAEYDGVASVQASHYGNPVSYTPEERPVNAFDGNLRTQWRVGAFDDVDGERIVVRTDGPVSADRINLVQPLQPMGNRTIAHATVRFFDGAGRGVGAPVEVVLGPSSLEAVGQELRFERRTFTRLEITVDRTDRGDLDDYRGVSGVGFAEIRLFDGDHLPDAPSLVRAREFVRLPGDLLAAVAEANGPGATLDHRLVILMSRLRTNPAELFRADPEPALARRFDLPDGRSFALTGQARISDAIADDTLDGLLGRPGLADRAPAARSSDRLAGALRARASSAFDGDPATAWTPGLHEQVGRWIEIETPAPVTFDRLDLVVVADGRHTVPTRLRLEPDGADPVSVELPPVPDSAAENATAPMTVTLPSAITSSKVRIVIEATRIVTARDGGGSTQLPVALAEVGIPGVTMAAVADSLPAICRDGLLMIDGRPVGVLVSGSTADALDGAGLDVGVCSADGGTPAIELAAGGHEVQTADRSIAPLQLDRLELRSDVGGTAPGPEMLAAWPSRLGPAPQVRVLDSDATSFELEISGATDPFWLVLGQSHNDGWDAVLSSGGHLEGPQRFDGFANAWHVVPASEGGTFRVALEWEPQRLVWVALAISSVGAALCVLIVVGGWQRGRRRAWTEAPPEVSAAGDGPVGDTDLVQVRVEAGPVLHPEPISPPRPWRTVLAALAAGGAAAAVVDPLWGLALMVLTGGALHLGSWWARLPMRLAPWLIVAGSGAWVAASQLRSGFPLEFAWTSNFEALHQPVLFAMMVLAADVVIERFATPAPVVAADGSGLVAGTPDTADTADPAHQPRSAHPV